MLFDSQFEVKKIGDVYYVYSLKLGVVFKNRDLNIAYEDAGRAADKLAEAFHEAKIEFPYITSVQRQVSIRTLLTANLTAFAIKSVIFIVIVALGLLTIPRILPVRGLSDLANYSSLIPDQRRAGIIRNAKEIGKISKPILEEIGLGCRCADSNE